jgi:hypothetical protein
MFPNLFVTRWGFIIWLPSGGLQRIAQRFKRTKLLPTSKMAVLQTDKPLTARKIVLRKPCKTNCQPYTLENDTFKPIHCNE